MVTETLPARARSWLRSVGAVREPPLLLVGDTRARIFLTSFALLFFELLCIRWIPSYVRFLSYFTNFLLLASFLGMGLGILAARRPRLWLPPFPLLLLLVAVLTAWNKFELRIYSTDVLYYGVGEAA